MLVACILVQYTCVCLCLIVFTWITVCVKCESDYLCVDLMCVCLCLIVFTLYILVMCLLVPDRVYVDNGLCQM